MKTMKIEGNVYRSLVQKSMERDNMLGMGAPNLVRDRMYEQSDKFKAWICNICGLPAIVDKTKNIRECRVCGRNDVSQIDLPYGTKLATQELAGMNIVARMLTDPFDPSKK